MPTAERSRIVTAAVVGALLALAAGFYAVSDEGLGSEQHEGIAFAGGHPDALGPVLREVRQPSSADARGAVPVNASGVGTPAAADDVVVTLYLDLLCPRCREFEHINGQDLVTLAAQDGVTVEYHVVAGLDHLSFGTFSSTRAANALATVADSDPDHFVAFLRELYATWPEDDGDGLSDAEIATVAVEVGVPATVVGTFTDTVRGTYRMYRMYAGPYDDDTGPGEQHEGTWRTWAEWLHATTGQMRSDQNRTSTPIVLLDGELFTQWHQPGALRTATLEARTLRS